MQATAAVPTSYYVCVAMNHFVMITQLFAPLRHAAIACMLAADASIGHDSDSQVTIWHFQ
jgi:hypothetical protein